MFDCSAHVSLKSGGAKEANALGLFFSNHGHDDHRKVLTCSEQTNKLRSFILKVFFCEDSEQRMGLPVVLTSVVRVIVSPRAIYMLDQ